MIKKGYVYDVIRIMSSLKKGDSYDKMLKTITICIVDGVLFTGQEQYLSNFRFLEESGGYCLTETTGICIIELPKVNPMGKPIENLTPLELCLEYIRYADEKRSDYVDALIKKGGKELEMAQYILEKTTEEEIVREKALAREKFLQDMASRMQHLQEKYEEGRKAGLDEGRLEMAKALKKEGICTEKIMAYTGLTEQEISGL